MPWGKVRGCGGGNAADTTKPNLSYCSWTMIPLLLAGLVSLSVGQVLTPPYFNLAIGRPIEATATCGVGVSEPELFCKLTGANPDKEDVIGDFEVIQGQLCDKCDRNEATRTHSPEYAVDGTERWWQSPPLSRGLQFNEVNLTINLQQEFHVAYVFIKMGNSPRPGVFALERSTDHGQTWKSWQYFADTPSDCNTFFGRGSYSDHIVRDDSVICTTEFSKVVPLEGGEIVVSLVNNRPSSNNFSYSQSLQDWTKATDIRLRLLRTKTLLGHLMAVARQDPTVTRRYYYSIKDISIGGQCVCNGHADDCDRTDPEDTTKLVCRCQHNTCGQQCDVCCPGFVQKPWRPATLGAINECEPCQCHGHSRDCRYDPEVDRNRSSIDIHGRYEGGGVCINCQHNTFGINCEQCRPGFYRPYSVPINSTRACRRCSCDLTYSTGNCLEGSGQCQCKPEYTGISCDRCNDGYYSFPQCIPCQCHINGTQGRVCEVGGGQCPCKPNFHGNNCDQCAVDYYNFPQCQSCDCDNIGSRGRRCDVRTGQCSCRPNFSGRNCGSCAPGFYNYPACDSCSCDKNGATAEVCDKDYGRCICKENFYGARCEQCAPGYFNFPHCIPCGCNEIGMQNSACDSAGQCTCKRNYRGAKCDECALGFYKYPECLECRCDVYGSYGITCDQQTGQCQCAPTFEGLTCNRCKPNYYNYPTCEECSCDPAGAKEVPGYPLGGCGAHAGGQLCECKDRVGGRICDTCRPGFWNLNIHNPDGCEDCGCETRGTNGGSRICDVVTGQCVCKPFVNSIRCNECADGTYNLQESNVFGCQACKCDVGGSLDQNCDKTSGQCNCKPRVNGKKCENPIATHYYPTLYHIMYELEDGHTPSRGAVRYGFDSRTFPDYSWKGYAIFSKIQDEVIVDVDIRKPSLYRIVYRFVNPSDRSIAAEVSAIPESSSDTLQTKPVTFPSARQPELVTVSSGGVNSAFELNPGRWSISLKVPETLFVDYLVLLPQAYYEAAILQEKINIPCALPSTGEICKHFVYVNVSVYSSVRGETGVTRVGGSEHDRTQTYPDRSISDKFGVRDLAYLNNRQTSLTLNLPVRTSGKYIFIIQYYSQATGRLQELDVDVVTSGGRDRGSLKLPGCPYSSLCRQAVIDSYGNPKEFTIDGSYATITINGRPDIDLAVDSIIAIPVNEWKIDFISPQLQCVRKDDQCISGKYITPASTVRVDFESGNEHHIATDTPPHIIDTTIKVIKLDGSAPTVHVDAVVSNPGKYVLVGHYYQPYITGFDVDVYVTVHGETYKGTLETNYCPGVSGCRSLIKFKDVDDVSAVDLSDRNIRITFNSSRPIWLDYLMVIPSVQFNPKTVLNIQDVDQSVEFITKCGGHEFAIDSTDSKYCRDAVFSLTTDYNNGALQCQCNGDGSLSYTCNEFGGQCRCKPNVIGRTCSSCKTGFYGFPNCRQCRCPSGFCDPNTGQCVCPPRVTGANCDTCLPKTFGFDPLVGCEECSCDQKGVTGGNTDCEVESGQCHCKPGITGRRCNKCHTGYYGFPRCHECSCDRSGVTSDVCNQRTAECLCKSNVDGPQCSQCKSGTFYLEERNPKGCTQCFCFGITTRCESSNYRWAPIVRMDGWGLTNLHNPSLSKVGDRLEARNLHLMDENDAIYWIAPSPYLGNHVTSYGGKLTYTVLFTESRNRPSKGEVHADLRIEGHEFTIVHVAREQPVPGESLTVEVDLLETKFEHQSSGTPVTREQFMLVLSRIRALHIRGSYYSAVESIQLSDVRLDIANADGRGAEALNVEHCHCPPNYSGTSCEQCATGYYRSKQGPYLGACVPCQCNSRATSCDPDSGECQNCQDNFHGPQCLACKRGYYLNAYTNVCEICGCPLQVDSNNFAATCQVSSPGRVERCDCYTGYAGSKCERCDIGYWGNPTRPGGSCRPCECSGNIDLGDPQSCDVETGRCVRCQDNTAGERCERCKDWYYGDAIDLKSCRPCVCNTIGSELCDHESGACLCKPNVVGATCNRCIPGAYGFDSGRGCELCSCGAASESTDCDLYTGQCQCRPGVSGRKCDQCEAGYWNYSPRGCQRCTCLSSGATTCDPLTGQCQCLPGVTGPSCDQCLPRWIMIPGRGCQECDNCIHLLMDDIEFLDHNVTTMRRELDSISVGILAFQRLEKINQTVAELRPQVDDLTNRPTDTSQLNPIKRELHEVQTLAGEVTQKSDLAVRHSDLVESDASDVKDRAETLYRDLVQTAIRDANDAVNFVKSILEAITGNIGSSNVDELLRQAETMLDEIKRRDFSTKDNAAREELTKARDALRRAKELMDRATSQANRTVEISILIDDIRNKLQDLQNSSRHSMDNSQAASAMNTRIRQLVKFVTESISKIRQMQTDVNNCIERARKMLDDARQFLNDARQAYVDMERESSRLDAAIGDIRHFVDELSDQNKNLRPLVENATEHARELQRHADNLESLIANTRESSEAALNASNAYRAITIAINSAMNASLDAIRVAEEASRLSLGLAAEAKRSRERSENLKSSADEIADKVNHDLRLRLETAKRKLEDITRINIYIKDQITEITIGLDGLPAEGFGDKAREAADRAMDAQAKAVAAENKITDIVNRLPEDQRKLAEIPNDIELANQNIRTAENEVSQVNRLVPDVIRLLDHLSSYSARIRQLGLDLKANISLLRNNVSAARDQANLITVGVSFNEETSLQVRNPRNLLTAGAYSRVSIYFNTTSTNGFLFFAGPNSTRTKWDYMSLQIIDSKAVFKFDLGDGAAMITNPKNVSDGRWHEAIMERTGKKGNLTIRTDNEPDEIASGESAGSSSVLDFDHYTQLFIGGIPDNAIHLRDILRFTRYSGCIEDVEFDGVALGLWNFVTAKSVQGCTGRNVLQEPLFNGYMFGGNGYVILSKDRFNTQKASTVSFSFRTFASEGLMFLMGTPGKDFFSLELKDGKVVFQFELGSGGAYLDSSGRYNDGNWHLLSASRLAQDGLLKIDSYSVSSGKSKGNLKDLDTDNFIYIGGFKGTHSFSSVNVTQKGFEGCIKNIRLGSTERNINEHLEAKDILPGCPEKAIVRVVSFVHGQQNSYVGVDAVSIDINFEITMKFKTLESNGLLFYAADELQHNAFSLSLHNQKVVVINVVDSQRTVLESLKDTYSDGLWHYLTVTKIGKGLSLHIDDTDLTATRIEGKQRTPTTSPLYFGGLPSTFAVVLNNFANRDPFVGCIGDVTIKQQLINFGSIHSESMSGAILSSCHIPDPTPPPPIVISLPSRAPTTYFTTALPPDKCQLPLEPSHTAETPEAGDQFGSRPDSRLEYDSFPSSNTNRAEYNFDFKTTSKRGIIFYVASRQHVDFVGIYISDGYVNAAFNCGGGIARITSVVMYDDGEWHNVVFSRNQKEGTLTIDGREVSTTAPGTSNSIEIDLPYYVGGLPSDINAKAFTNLNNVSSGFVGCVRKFMQDGREIGAADRRVSVSSCSMSHEIGTFFYSDAGHLVLNDNFSVPDDLEIMLEIKPRSLSGVILSVHNRVKGHLADYLVLQMVDGNVIFTMNNGKGAVTSNYQPPAKNNLCDGKWHTIHAQKAKNVVTLKVDKVFTHPGVGAAGFFKTDTADPLYLGGVPETHPGIETSASFVGCIRHLELNKATQDFSRARPVGRIDLNSCPTT